MFSISDLEQALDISGRLNPLKELIISDLYFKAFPKSTGATSSLDLNEQEGKSSIGLLSTPRNGHGESPRKQPSPRKQESPRKTPRGNNKAAKDSGIKDEATDSKIHLSVWKDDYPSTNNNNKNNNSTVHHTFPLTTREDVIDQGGSHGNLT